MNLHRLLPVIAISLTTALTAQQTANAYQVRQSLFEHLEHLSPAELTEITAAAQSFDPSSQYQLGLIYGRGSIVPQDLEARTTWLHKSAAQAYVPAQAAFGSLCLHGPSDEITAEDCAEAERYLRLAANAGDANAQLDLAHVYWDGILRPADYPETLKWLRLAAAQHHPIAEINLGELYFLGHGVPQNDSIAAGWFKKAADDAFDWNDQWLAIAKLDNLYRDTPLSNDRLEAYKWAIILDSHLDAPIDDNVKNAAKYLTRSQRAEGQRLAALWMNSHLQPPRP
jgi:uncharacterized protein